MVRNVGRRRVAEAAIVALLLGLHAWLAISSSRGKSAAFDEIAHLAGGYLHWKIGDYRFAAESGTLPQRWAAWPLLALDLGVPPAGHPARRGANVWALGQELLHGGGRNAEALLQVGRSMIVVLSLALGCLVYAWSRASHGPGGGLLSLALYALSPTMLAHARLITADLFAAGFFLLATGALWRLLERVTPARFAGAALAVSGLQLSKMSGALILPIAAILILLRLAPRRPAGAQPSAPTLELAFGSRGSKRLEIVSWKHQVLVVGVLALAVSLVVLGAVWSAYGWRYAAQPDAGPEGSVFLHPFEPLLEHEGLTTGVLAVARDAQLLPEAYLWGLAFTLDNIREGDAFLRGQTSHTGWWWFFPYAVAVKTPLALFGLLGLAAVAVWRVPRLARDHAPLWALLGVYLLAAAGSHLNIGHRHILPIYPVLFVFAGAAGRWIVRRKPLASMLVLLCVGSFMWESQKIRPHYLSYFNPLAGGPANGYRHLVDSSLDWGQDLPLLASYLAELEATEEPTEIFIALFGSAPPAYYGINGRWLYSFFDIADPSRPPPTLSGGVYCISATLLQTMHIELPGPWTTEREQAYREQREQVESLVGGEGTAAELSPYDLSRLFRSYSRLRSARLFAFLRRREPDARVGYSILVYRLSDTDVEQALRAPPGSGDP